MNDRASNLHPLFQQIVAPFIGEAVVTPEPGPSTTRYVITGSPEATKRAVEALEREYPSWGYGTRHEYTDTGAVVTRFNNAD